MYYRHFLGSLAYQYFKGITSTRQFGAENLKPSRKLTIEVLMEVIKMLVVELESCFRISTNINTFCTSGLFRLTGANAAKKRFHKLAVVDSELEGRMLARRVLSLNRVKGSKTFFNSCCNWNFRFMD